MTLVFVSAVTRVLFKSLVILILNWQC